MYKITSITEKKWQDKVFYELALEGIAEPVSCWGDLKDKKVGDEVDGVVAPNKKGYPQLTLAGVPKTFSNKKADIAEAQARTQQGVQQAQEHKDSSVKISATFRDATAITLEEMAFIQHNGDYANKFQERWLYWRKWLNSNFDGLPF